MTKLGKPVDLTKLNWATMKNRFQNIGIELEGGWSTVPSGARIIRDGSVHIPESELLSKRIQAIGEIPSPILDFSNGPRNWEKWLRAHYPTAVNDSCGMHIHVSPRTALMYMRCMSPQFPATILDSVRKWAGDVKLPDSNPLWDRLAGNSRYCQHVYSAEDQILATTKDYDMRRVGHRYTVIHFSYARTGTIECRLLPMMETPDLAVSAINHVVNTMNAFLVATATKESKIKVDVQTTDDNFQRIREIHV